MSGRKAIRTTVDGIQSTDVQRATKMARLYNDDAVLCKREYVVIIESNENTKDT